MMKTKSAQALTVPSESARGLRRTVVFVLPLLILFSLDAQGVSPLLNALFPHVRSALAAHGLDSYRAELFAFLFDAIAAVVSTVAVAELIRRFYALEPSELGWRRPTRWPLRVLAGVAAGILLVLFWGIAKNLRSEIFFQRLPYIRVGGSPGWRTIRSVPDLLNLIGNWTFSAPAEEILFRGAIYGALRRRFSRLAALPLSAVLFAWAHFPWLGARAFTPFYFGWQIFTGMAFGAMLEWDGSLLTPIVAHSVLDAMVFSFGVSFMMT